MVSERCKQAKFTGHFFERPPKERMTQIHISKINMYTFFCVYIYIYTSICMLARRAKSEPTYMFTFPGHIYIYIYIQTSVWFLVLVGNGGVDPYSRPYIISNNSPHTPFPHSLLSTRQTWPGEASVPAAGAGAVGHTTSSAASESGMQAELVDSGFRVLVHIHVRTVFKPCLLSAARVVFQCQQC